MRRSFSGKRAGEHWGQLGKILKTRPAWWNSVLKINLHWICLNKFATPTSRMYRNKNTTASACTFFFCHYFWFLAYRWTHNTQVCVKTQVFFFLFFSPVHFNQKWIIGIQVRRSRVWIPMMLQPSVAGTQWSEIGRVVRVGRVLFSLLVDCAYLWAHTLYVLEGR